MGEALDLTPAYCMSVASFYDMLHLEPVGTHTIEVCTNVCCGLVNAQAVLEAFELELGVAPGETTSDGAITLRAVECLGGCSTPTLVAVDHRYRQSVTPEDVPAIVRGAAECRLSPVLVLAGAEEAAAPRPGRVPRGRRLRAAREGRGRWSRSR